MSNEEHTRRTVSFDQIPTNQRESLKAQLPEKSGCGCGCLVIVIILAFILFFLT